MSRKYRKDSDSIHDIVDAKPDSVKTPKIVTDRITADRVEITSRTGDTDRISIDRANMDRIIDRLNTDRLGLNPSRIGTDIIDESEQAREYMIDRILDRLKYCSDTRVQSIFDYLVGDDVSSIGSGISSTLSGYGHKAMNVDEAVGNLKYNYVLGLANRILETVGKPSIRTLLEFEIHRSDMLNDQIKTIIDEEEQNIMAAGFDRASTGYYQKEAIQTFHLTVFKKLIKQIGYNLISKNNRKRGEKSYTTYKVVQV